MREIPPLSILSENTIFLDKNTGERTEDYIVRREVEVIEVTTFIHEEVKDSEKENRQGLIVYRAESGAIRRVHPNHS